MATQSPSATTSTEGNFQNSGVFSFDFCPTFDFDLALFCNWN